MSTNTATKHPTDHLQDRQVDPESGMHIGYVTVGEQRLRVGIHPAKAPASAAPRSGKPQGAAKSRSTSPPGDASATATTKAPPLLLFNGIGANLELAGLLIGRLAHVETIIFDIPGAGKSPAPKYPYRLSHMAKLATELLDQLGYTGAVDVMGVSWGGTLAQQYAIQFPGRVRRLILAATAMGPPAMLPGSPSALLRMANPRRYLDKSYMERVAPTIYGGELRSNPEAIKLFTAHLRGGTKVGYRYQMLAMLGWSAVPWLWRIQHPTLVLAGSDDPLVPLINARLHAWLLPDAKLHIFQDGHLFLLTQADSTARIIGEFLG